MKSTEPITRNELFWLVGFLGVTTTAVAMELIAVGKKHPHMPAWTTLIVKHIPKPVALAAAGTLSVWLPGHLHRFYKKALADMQN